MPNPVAAPAVMPPPAAAAPPIAGVLAALPTPFDAGGGLVTAAVAPLLDHVAALGCHGALLAGSTGEGPSLAHDERVALVAAAAAWRAARPAGSAAFTLLAGSGVPAWPEAARATAAVVQAGADSAVVLPPYFFKDVPEDGLYDWFRRVIDGAGGLLAAGGDALSPLRILLYDIPRHTGVPIPTAVLVRLRADYGPSGPFAGLKDSTGDAALTIERVAALPGAAVLTGTDSHLSTVLTAGGTGAITALSSIFGDLARAVWDAHAAAAGLPEAQAALDGARATAAAWPAIPAIKAVLDASLGGACWRVRPPLRDLPPAEGARVVEALAGGRHGPAATAVGSGR